MKLIQMKCPSCGANLSVDDGLDTFFCQYCGTKIMLDGQSNAALKAKVASKALDKVDAMHRRHSERKRAEEEYRRKTLPYILIGCLLVIILVFTILFIPIRKEDKRIEAVYAEIQADIAAGNYDAALAKTPGLHYSRDISREDAVKWDKIREELIEIINAAKNG